MSGTSYGACVLHVTPEAFVGGPLALVRDGDLIQLDVSARTLSLLVSDEELADTSCGVGGPAAEVRAWVRVALLAPRVAGGPRLRLRLPRDEARLIVASRAGDSLSPVPRSEISSAALRLACYARALLFFFGSPSIYYPFHFFPFFCFSLNYLIGYLAAFAVYPRSLGSFNNLCRGCVFFLVVFFL